MLSSQSSNLLTVRESWQYILYIRAEQWIVPELQMQTADRQADGQTQQF